MLQAIWLVFLWFIAGSLTFGIGFVAFPIVYWFVVIRGSDARAAKAQEKLQSTLMRDEAVVVSAIQKRVAALLVRRELVAITSSRVITIARSWFGGFTMRDYQWKDLHDAQLEENMIPNLFGSNLRFIVGASSSPMTLQSQVEQFRALNEGGRAVSSRPELRIRSIPSDVAAKIYSHAQSEEQAWEEKRRVRALEESRASSGGVTIHTGVPAQGGSGGTSVVEELAKAKNLFDSGAISDAEYQEIKAKIISR